MDDSRRQTRLFTTVGIAITAAYIGAIVAWCALNPAPMQTLQPNTFGDFLAGVFGPLAFAWLVLGYFQQGAELQQNTKALEIQAEELKNSTEALRFQVEELRQSVEQQRKLAELASEQLAYERERNLAEQRERSEKYRPSFELTNLNVYASSAPAICEMRVMNSGAYVSIPYCKTNNANEDSLSVKNDWQTSDVVTLLPFRAGRDPREDVEIEIGFRQQDGGRGILRITMKAAGDRSYGAPTLSTEYS